MKFLECPELEYINTLFSDIDLGDSLFVGKVEAYSCKRAGEDKKLAKLLESQLAAESARSPPLSCSPFGPLGESQSRRTFIDLIATLNASYQDYDFSTLRADQFTKESSFGVVASTINTALADLYARIGRPDFPALLWRAIDETIETADCDVYSYLPDEDSDPFSEEGGIWSFNYFFYNKKMKKILFLACRRVRKVDTMIGDDSDDELLLSDGEDVSMGESNLLYA
eukprot:TRINITY_DN15240_c0_g1_i1.p1 TRINITY_DN15240_c0_g1~~TRINITY_DN15240_c0_g1_i1.p1  ORF type:complete len:226 (+),score=25.81 TRINITY_DN15240_c0_g1_i1:33-710(+)